MTRFARFAPGLRSLAFLSLLLAGHAAGAATIVDTGPGTSFDFAQSVNPNQSLAAEFSITEAYRLTSIEGWFAANSSTSIGTITAVIYNDGGEIPGQQLFAQSFAINSATPDFYGVSSIDWLLQAGTYWVAFEVRSTQTFAGLMPRVTTNPLGNEAVSNLLNNGYGEFDGANIGVRIEGSPVPVPAAAWLLGSALVGLAGLRRRRQGDA